MSDLRTAAQQALEDICGARLCDVNSMSSRRESLRLLGKAADTLRAALAEPCPCGDRPAAQCPGEWEPGCDLGNNPKYAKRVEMTPKELAASIKRGEKWKVAEPDLFHCPNCGGPADNGHDRSIPPSPYWCTKCMAEPAQERNFCSRCGKRTNDIHTCTPPPADPEGGGNLPPPLQEPAALLTTWISETEAVTEPLFRAPRRLTDAEIGEVWFAARIHGLNETDARRLIRAAEQRSGAR